MRAPRSWQMMDLPRIIGDPVSRRGFLAASGVTFAAGSAVFVAACGSDSGGSTSDTDTDVAILSDALALELTAVEAYSKGSKLLAGAELEAARAFLTHEQEHADALTKAIKLRGGEGGVDPVPLDFSAAKSSHDVLRFITGIENVAIAAYVDAIPKFSTPELRATAAEIVAAEAEHVAVLAGAIGRPQAPGAFVSGDADALAGSRQQTGVAVEVPKSGMTK